MSGGPPTTIIWEYAIEDAGRTGALNMATDAQSRSEIVGKKLGAVLVELGFITEEQLEKVLFQIFFSSL